MVDLVVVVVAQVVLVEELVGHEVLAHAGEGVLRRHDVDEVVEDLVVRVVEEVLAVERAVGDLAELLREPREVLGLVPRLRRPEGEGVDRVAQVRVRRRGDLQRPGRVVAVDVALDLAAREAPLGALLRVDDALVAALPLRDRVELRHLQRLLHGPRLAPDRRAPELDGEVRALEVREIQVHVHAQLRRHVHLEVDDLAHGARAEEDVGLRDEHEGHEDYGDEREDAAARRRRHEVRRHLRVHVEGILHGSCQPASPPWMREVVSRGRELPNQQLAAKARARPKLAGRAGTSVRPIL